MSQLNAFMDGLGEARQQSERDTRLAMDIEGRRAALASQMAQESRASERMQMDRDKAIRETRDSDFDYEQKQTAVSREKEFGDKMKAWSQTYLSPQRAQGPDGQERQAPPKQATLGGQLEMYRDYVGIMTEYGKLKPEMLKQYAEFGEQAKKDGLMDAIVKAGAGDNSGLANVMRGYGVNPQTIQMKTVRNPNSQLATTKLAGIGADGKPFEFDFTPLLIFNGLNYDPDKAGNDQVLTSARINQANAAAGESRDRGRAALQRAGAYERVQGARASALGGGGGSSSAPSFSEKESRDFDAALNRSAPKVSRDGKTVVDEEGRELLRQSGLMYFESRVSDPTKPRRPNVTETISEAQKILQAANQRTQKLLPDAAFVMDRNTRTPRLVPSGTEGAVPFARIPPDQKQDALNQLRRQILAEARQKFLDRQAEERRGRALAMPDDGAAD